MSLDVIKSSLGAKLPQVRITTLYQDDISQVEVIASQIQLYTAITQPHFKYKFIIKTDYVEFAELKGTPGLELKLPDKKTGSLSFYKIAGGGSK